MEKIILNLHKKGLIDTEIAKIINKSPDTVAYYRKKLNLVNNRNKNSIKNKNKILKLLKEKVTIYKIKKETGCSTTYIKKVAKNNNIDTLTKKDFINKVKKVKNNPFTNLQDPDTNYWLGFLAADGAIFEDRLSLTLQEQDYKHMVKFAKFISPSLKVKEIIHHNKYKLYHVSFRNKEIVNYLHNLGITNRKSYTLNMNIKINKDFLRGVIDGDGYIRKNKYEISIVTASKKFAIQLKKAYKNLFNIEAKFYEFKPNIYTISVLKKKEVKLILQELYFNAHIFLKRKYDNAVLISNN